MMIRPFWRFISRRDSQVFVSSAAEITPRAMGVAKA